MRYATLTKTLALLCVTTLSIACGDEEGGKDGSGGANAAGGGGGTGGGEAGGRGGLQSYDRGLPKPAGINPAPPLAVAVDFESDTAGDPPALFTFGLDGAGTEGAWQVNEDAEAQTGTQLVTLSGNDGAFGTVASLALYDAEQAADVDVQLAIKTEDGENGGVVFGASGLDSYNVLTFNPADDMLRAWHVESGVREQRGEMDVTSLNAIGDVKDWGGPDWHYLRAVVVDGHVWAMFDWTPLFEYDEPGFAAGNVGLWADGASTPLFDDLEIAE